MARQYAGLSLQTTIKKSEQEQVQKYNPNHGEGGRFASHGGAAATPVKGHMQVAETIRQQLGGHRFAAMTGAKNFMAHNENGGALSFRLPGGGGFTKQGINYGKITLDKGTDTYNMEMGRMRGANYKKLVNESGVHGSDLQGRIREHTGLATHL